MATSASRVLAIDVECVATGYTHEDRAPCSVAVVDEQCQLIFSSLIKPIGKCVSDLYAFTGLRLSELEQAPTYDEVMAKLYPLFNPSTIIVGQSPKNDVKWLKLEKGVHYRQIIDLSDWFKVLNPRFRTMSHFSLAHEAWVLLGVDLNAQTGHLATQDARASMQLYIKYKDSEKAKGEARQRLLGTRPRMTPAKACNYQYEGVCLGGFFKKMCTCDRPSFAND